MATTTHTHSQYSLSLLGKDPSPPSTRTPSTHRRPRSNLLVEPLVPSGKLTEKEFPHELLTSAIGVQFDKQVQLTDILQLPQSERDEIVRELAILISLQGVAFFKAQDNLTPDDLGTLALLLGTLSGKPSDSTLHIHPTQELGEDGKRVGKISNVPETGGRQISFRDESSTIASALWHSDVSFEPRPSSYTILKMHTLPKTGGDTLFSSAYEIYNKLSPAMAAFLEPLSAIHDAEIFRQQSRRHGFALRTEERGSPLNVGDAFQARHPVIRTNPVTGLKGVFVNRTFTTRIEGLSFDESHAILAYLFALQHGSHDAQVRYRWKANDVAIWDNRNTTHAATFDYSEYRAGDRVVCVGETPYLDPNSISKKEWERIQEEDGRE